MPRAVVMDVLNGMASSFAVGMDALTTANAMRACAVGPEPLALHRLRTTRATSFRFRTGDVVIVPGIYAESASELLRRLASPPVQRAVHLVRNARAAGATVAASCGGTFVIAEAGLLD